MTARRRQWFGWGLFVIVLVALAVYMASVGWTRAAVIAGVAGFFVTAAGLAYTVSAGPPTSPRGSDRSKMIMVDVNAPSVEQSGEVRPGDEVSMIMKRVTAVTGRAGQFLRVADTRHGRSEAGRDV